jgi:hypothetical protein
VKHYIIENFIRSEHEDHNDIRLVGIYHSFKKALKVASKKAVNITEINLTEDDFAIIKYEGFTDADTWYEVKEFEND